MTWMRFGPGGLTAGTKPRLHVCETWLAPILPPHWAQSPRAPTTSHGTHLALSLTLCLHLAF